jgi:hypothetical protein
MKHFLLTVGSVCRVKQFTTRSRNVAKVSLMTKTLKLRRGCGWHIKRLLCCRFRGTGKAMGQVYQCSWRICREINVLSRFDYHMFMLYIHLWPVYWLFFMFLWNLASEFIKTTAFTKLVQFPPSCEQVLRGNLLCWDLSGAALNPGQLSSVVSSSTEDGNVNNFENVVILMSQDNGIILKRVIKNK